MNCVYVLKYEEIGNNNEILGVYTDKWEAVEELILRANYREKNGHLTQYKKPTDDYPSMDFLRNKVYNDLVIEDMDCFYSIEIIPINERSKERMKSAA